MEEVKMFKNEIFNLVESNINKPNTISYVLKVVNSMQNGCNINESDFCNKIINVIKKYNMINNNTKINILLNTIDYFLN